MLQIHAFVFRFVVILQRKDCKRKLKGNNNQ